MDNQTLELLLQLPDVGKPCSSCGVVVIAKDIRCGTCKQEGKEQVLQEVCRCVHPGDLMCPYHYRYF